MTTPISSLRQSASTPVQHLPSNHKPRTNVQPINMQIKTILITATALVLGFATADKFKVDEVSPSSLTQPPCPGPDAQLKYAAEGLALVARDRFKVDEASLDATFPESASAQSVNTEQYEAEGPALVARDRFKVDEVSWKRDLSEFGGTKEPERCG